jgi:hypothetical protein
LKISQARLTEAAADMGFRPDRLGKVSHMISNNKRLRLPHPHRGQLGALARQSMLFHNVGKYSQIPTVRNNDTDTRRKTTEVYQKTR